MASQKSCFWEGLQATLLLIAWPLIVIATIIWRLAKFLLFWAVIYGALHQLSEYLPSEWPSLLSVEGLWASGIAILKAAAQAWVWIAIALCSFRHGEAGRPPTV